MVRIVLRFVMMVIMPISLVVCAMLVIPHVDYVKVHHLTIVRHAPKV